MQAETAISGALRKAGWSSKNRLTTTVASVLAESKGDGLKASRALWLRLKQDNELALAAMKVVIAAFAEADELPGEGQDICFEHDHRSDSNARQTERDGKANGFSSRDQNTSANSSRQISGDSDQRVVAAKAVPFISVPRDPSKAQNLAVQNAKNVVALSIFDRQKTHTGRRWGGVYYRELDSLREDGELASAVKIHIGSLRGDDRHKTIAELMTPGQFHACLRKVGVKAA